MKKHTILCAWAILTLVCCFHRQLSLFGQSPSQRIVRDFDHESGLHGTQNENLIMLSKSDDGRRGITISEQKLSRGSIVFREEVQLSSDAPFLMCGISLKISNASAENVRVFVRPYREIVNAHSSANIAQSSWQYLPFDSHTEDESEEIAPEESASLFVGNVTLRTHIATLPADTRWVEVKIELSRSLLRSMPVLQQYQCYLHNPGKTDASSQALILQTLVQGSSLNRQINKSTATLQNNSFLRPAFVTRTQWGCPWGQTSGPNTLTPTVPTHIIVHHSFSPGNDVTDWAAAVRGVWNFHVNSNGWSDIGYNWLIDPQGVIYQGRAWIDSMDNAQGAHFCGFNRATMGICMLGDFNSVSPTEAAQRSLVRLLAYRVSANNIDPRVITFHANSNRNLNTISGHRDGCATDCPGNMQYPLLATYRNRVFALLNPPAISNATANVENTQSSATLWAFIRPNGSATQVFVEWEEARSARLPFTNRRLIHEFSAQDTAKTVATRITGLLANTNYVYRIVAQNSDTSAQTAPTMFSLTSTSSAIQQSDDGLFFNLSPNPSNGEVQCRFTLEATSYVRFTIRDVRGTIVAQTVNAYLSSGSHNITLREDNLASGIYYCYLEVLNSLHARSASKVLSVLR